MADIKKYLDTTALGALVDQVKAEDAKVLAAAKAHAEGLGKNYDAAGSASTAEANAKAYTDALANGQVATNKSDIETLKGTGEGSVSKAVSDAKSELQGKIDAVSAVAEQNKTDIAAINNTESGILAQAKSYTDGEVAKVQGEVDALEGVVGELPEGETSVVAYINKKTDGIATSGNLEALGNRVTTVENKVSTIEGDYLKGADKTELEGKISTKADQSALDAVSSIANAAVKQSDYDTKVQALEGEDARIVGLVEAEAERAAGVEAGLDERLEKVEAFFVGAAEDEGEGENLKNALDTLVEIQNYIDTDGAAADEMVKDIAANAKAIEDHVATDHDFAGADAALKAELEGKIGTKAESSVVTELSGKVTANGEAITALQGEDTAIKGRLDVLEGKFGDGEGSVEDMIAAAKEEAISTAGTNADTKDEAVLAAAKKYADDEDALIEARVATLETESAKHALASDVTSLAGRVGTAEGEIDTLQSEMDAVEALAAANKAAHEANASAIALKASQSDLDAAVARIAANEGSIGTINTTLADKAEADDLEAAVARIAANETAIAANTSAINSFSAITVDEVNALFA